MALNWNFDDKVGESTYIDELSGREFKYNLYQGNAYLIEVKEWTKKGKDYYDVKSFALDNRHLKMMLGLIGSESENTFDYSYHRLTKLVIYKDKCRRVKEISGLFKKAFNDNLEIIII